MSAFIVYPAIDLKGGACVRLLHGRMESATVYNDEPADQARLFEQSGCRWLHIVDLDGAFSGRSENAAAVSAIVEAVDLKIQLGGGVRSMAGVEGWLDAGVQRVILGTAAVRDPAFVKEAARAFPGRIAVGVDARDGRVKTDGWDGDTEFTSADIARRFEDAGVAAVIFTDIGRDGALTGVNVEETAGLAETVSIPVIASGGVASLDDITALREADAGIDGVIVGRALYDGRIDLNAALDAAAR